MFEYGQKTSGIGDTRTAGLNKIRSGLGIARDHLAVRDIQEQGLPHPFAPLLKALGVAGRAEAAGLAGERQQAFTVAVRARIRAKHGLSAI